MSNLSNEYEKILSFLEDQKKGDLSVKKNPPKNKSVQKKSKVKNEITKPRNREKEETVEKTKQIIEESEVYTYVPSESQQIPDSKGFSVSKFESLMRTRLIDNYKRIQSYERPYVSVTELIGCLRQAFYSRLKYKVDLKKQFSFSYLYLIQKVGDEIHSLILDLYDFTETEKTIVSEIYKVKGRIDGIRESYLHEIKSIDKEKFKNKYIREHYLQSLIYAYILNTEYDGYNIDMVTLTYVIRNLKRIVPFDIPLDNSLAKSLLERSPQLLSSIERKMPPDPLGATREHCVFCLYKKYCEKDPCSKIIQPFKIKEKKHKVEKKKPVFLI
ncbi:MAG: hypothetical protein PVG65_01110 [Candidatus Thorarchaeota archaeon]|jgi:hypothetical protein